MTAKLPVVLFILLIFPATAFSQKIVHQENFNHIGEVLSSADGNYLLVKSSFTFTLIDGRSNVQLGSMDVNSGDAAYPGQGKTQFVNDHKFAVNTMNDILLVDVLKEKIDTLKLNNKFPELIENFHVLSGEKNLMLIATKFYPMDKEETISFLEVNRKGEAKYDDSKNCRLYLYDYVQDKVIESTDIPYSLTAISDNGTDIFAGSFEGNILSIGTRLEYQELFRAGKEPIFYLKYIDEKFVVIPHLKKQVLFDLAKGEVRVFDRSGKVLEKLDLPSQPYPEEENKSSFFKVEPSNLVKNVLSTNSENILLINYGFNKLLKFNVSSGHKEELRTNKKFVDVHDLYFVDSQVLIAASNEKALASNPTGLAVYDFELQKEISLFSKADPTLGYSNLKKVYADENYYYYGQKDDLSVLFPSNQNRPLFIKDANGDGLNLNEESDLLLNSANHVIFGALDISRIKKDTLSLNYAYSKEMDDLPSGIFHPYFDSRDFKETELPYGIGNIQEIEKNVYLATGYNQELKNFYLVLDQEGKILFEREKLEIAVVDNKNHISPSGKYLAFDYSKGNSSFLEVWDWRANRLMYKNKYQDLTWWSYKFDANEDHLWLRITDENSDTSIHEVDLSLPKPANRVVLNDIATVDFAVDKNRNQLAIDNKTGIAILDLSTGKRLWSIRTSENSEIQQSKQGFDFGTTRSYYTVNADDLSSVYFTSFEGYQPIEISSDLYYAGEKNALRNIAFVANGRGYLPSDYDLYLNRPDTVLVQSGSTNSEYHKLIGQAVEKRTETLPTKDFIEFLQQSPELEIADRDNITNYTSAKEENIKFRLTSSSGTRLKSYHIHVNGVPLNGKKGKQIEEDSSSFETEIQLKLSRGANTIQLYGIDEKGFISNKEVVNIFADYQEDPQIHLILISADTYNDSDYNLKYPVKDARDLASNLKERYGNQLVVDSLFNEKITVENLSKIKEKISDISVNDRVILFLSGHGVLDSNLEFRFATPDMDFEQIDSYGITNTQIENLLLSSPSREKLLLIDACHSGEFDRDAYETTIASSQNEDVKMYEGRKGAVASSVRPSNSTFELMNQLFTDASAATGIKVISAAAGNSYALESDTWNNGVFTYALLSTLKENSSIPVSDLKNRAYRKVVTLTKGNQQPTSRGETIEFEFSL